jgi:hypothetical protein
MQRRVREFNRRRRAPSPGASFKELEAMLDRSHVRVALVSLVFFLIAATAYASGVTPAKGQSPEQTQKDVAECQALATQSSGFNPAAAPPPVASAPPQVGGRVKGAAKGAAAGRVAAGASGGEVYDAASDEAKQEYRQDQGQGAAAAGAVLGASKQRQDRRETRGAEKQQEADAQAKQAAYDQANQGCLAGRGYTVTP